MTRWGRFPPLTEEIQFDEKWAFVYQKEKRGDPACLEDERRGENWDHVAFDPQHRLVLEVVPGKRHQRQRRRNGRVVHLEPRLQFKWQRRTPAMAAGLTDHVWTLKEWITFPAKFC